MPVEQAKRIFAGEHPVRVWRELRGLDLDTLAHRTGLTPERLAAIESLSAKASPQELEVLAPVLKLDADDLELSRHVPQPPDA